jgi:PAS domain S-box-containing protein
MAGSEREPVNILVVDDVVQNLTALKEMLRNPDYAVVTATSGRDALRYLLTEEFALVLLDVAMPDMDGFEVASAIKQRERSKDIPIIFLTALRKDVTNVYRGYSAGAVDYLEKPLDPEVVKAKVGVFVELYRSKKDLQRKNDQIARQAELLRESERREQEYRIAELKRSSEARYRQLAESIPQIVWIALPDGEVDFFNQRWESVTGLKPLDSLGNRWYRALHPDDLPVFERLWLRSIHSAVPFETECRLGNAQGEYRWFLCQALPEKNAEDVIISWLGTFTDIDNSKRAEDERKGLLERAQDAVRLRDEFLSIASHELKTPLTSLHLQLQFLERRLITGTITEIPQSKLLEKVKKILNSSERLAALINEQLDVTRITAGRLGLERGEFDLVEAVQEVVSRFSFEIGPHLQVTATGPAVGNWDRSRLEQVISNLVSNAIKYGSGKPVELSVVDAGNAVELIVQDHGIGIEAAKLERIFERFERAVDSANYSGLGLGLYITREIVEAHGGSVKVASEAGSGSTFSIVLPKAASAAESIV